MIQQLSNLNVIFDEPIILNQNQSDEIYNNMWVLSFDEKAIHIATQQDLTQFLEKLLAHYKRVVLKNNPTITALFYLWLDPQTLQLRFNILSKTIEADLPFACKVKITHDYSAILQSFLDTNRLFILKGDVIEEVDEFEDEDDTKNFVLDVYVKTLN